MEKTQQITITRFTSGEASIIEDEVARERALTIILNGEELVTLLCSPGEFDYLAAGYLASEDIISTAADIKNLSVNEVTAVVRVETVGKVSTELTYKRVISSGCGRGAALYSAADVNSLNPVTSKLNVTPAQIYKLVRDFQHHSELFKETGGVHSAAIAEPVGIEFFTEDIGRHNAVDRLFGRAILGGLDFSSRMLLTSGRISSEIVSKVARRNVGLLISRSAPTSSAIELADRLNITLVGFVRGERMNVYTNPGRIVGGQQAPGGGAAMASSTGTQGP
ncbi:formate dehydrogenase accessory sulfurtransferase FdhD [Dehalogenimonas etheniformans]|uniref:formate dehydrogenase accessory sulfurtransferase FdhD n=1 Tax=Dehalogenimonas etheniformans TaxID=1536648 RepID=UPI00139234B7|nr:formate dehydrogenase accessory sulfurtransferase FdhD [Dehalogenimonas etheniformans]QNT75845.1 formate dehydrogenase accessory sulfurtransferase FdhD [Dehalogenimonas etheniformans]